MDELIGEFLGETAESLEVIDNELVKFEADPTDRATLDNIFRLVHTIKGTCGFLGLERLEAIAHAGETLLGKFRDGDLVADSAAVTLVLQSLDRIKDILGNLETAGSEGEGDDSDLISQLEAMSCGETVSAPAPECTFSRARRRRCRRARPAPPARPRPRARRRRRRRRRPRVASSRPPRLELAI